MRVPVRTVAAPDWGIPFSAEQRTGELPLFDTPLPTRVIVPLLQHSGAPATPLVAVGDTVMTGQPIGDIAPDTLGARVHAPISGTVTEISTGPVPGRRSALRIHIKSDGQDQRWADYTALDRPLSLSTSALRRAVIEAGIVGLGGATFPAGVKLNRGSGVDTLIMNAAECEPVINCDDVLLRDAADEVLLGAQVMMRILEADACVVAIKQGMSAALETMTAGIENLNDDRFSIALVPSIYPVGGEAQLIQMLTGEEIPSGGLPWDSSAICQNVATAAAIARFLNSGEPLISRVVTVTGGAVKAPGNYRTRIGTPMSDLLATAGTHQNTGRTALIMGGPMMGIALDSPDLPVTKATNCVYAPSPPEIANKPSPVACIRCGDCATACPANLMPQLLLQTKLTNDYDRLRELGLPDCIECGCCDYVCPSHIPLTREFVDAKQQLWQIGFEQRRARLAEKRTKAREERLARQAEETPLAGVPHHEVNDADNAKARLDELLKRVEPDAKTEDES